MPSDDIVKGYALNKDIFVKVSKEKPDDVPPRALEKGFVGTLLRHPYAGEEYDQIHDVN